MVRNIFTDPKLSQVGQDLQKWRVILDAQL